MAESRIADIFETVKAKQWGRWGADDERGTLNLLTPERVAAAARLVRSGVTVSCALDLESAPTVEAEGVRHMMLIAGDAPDASGFPGFVETNDYLGLAIHGMGVSHVNALCHILVDGQMYNGYPASSVKSNGASQNSVAGASEGIAGRGVFLDLPRLRGVDWIQPPDTILPDELDAAAAAEGVTVGPGDLLLVGTGRDARRDALGPLPAFEPGLVGLDAECILWLADRDVALLGSDGIIDSLPPNETPMWPFPIHQCSIGGLGLWTLDHLDLGRLATACAREQRWEFLLTVPTLRLPRATGSPVNPIAIL